MHVRVCALVSAGVGAVAVGSATANERVDVQTHAYLHTCMHARLTTELESFAIEW